MNAPVKLPENDLGILMLDVEQGSDEWHEVRGKYWPASEASAMLGQSKYKTRLALLKERFSGVKPEPTDFQKKLFESGHQAEAAARPLAEQFAGFELKPLVFIRDGLLSSLDGVNLEERVGWEHKDWNKQLVAYIEKHQDLPDTHWPQVEQQMFCADLDCVLFTVSGKGNAPLHFWYESKPERLEAVIKGWDQFEADLDSMTDEDLDAEEGREDEAWVTLADELVTLTNQMKPLEDRAKAVKAQLKELAEEGGEKTFGHGVVAYPSVRKTADYKRFFEDKELSLPDSYYKESTSWTVKVQ